MFLENNIEIINYFKLLIIFINEIINYWKQYLASSIYIEGT